MIYLHFVEVPPPTSGKFRSRVILTIQCSPVTFNALVIMLLIQNFFCDIAKLKFYHEIKLLLQLFYLSITMQEVYYPPKHLSSTAHIAGFDHYKKLYQESIESPEKFWDKVRTKLVLNKCKTIILSYVFESMSIYD